MTQIIKLPAWLVNSLCWEPVIKCNMRLNMLHVLSSVVCAAVFREKLYFK